tara:strand:+ start:726 stop:6560 length:5835 start_codon:yes stop_codon:yes gene_type:complete
MSNRENFEDTISKNEHVVHHDVQDVNREQNEYKTPQKNVPNDASDDARNNKRPRSNSEPTGLNISPNKFKTTKKAKTIRRTKSNSVTHMHYVKDGSSNGNNNLDSVQEGDGVQDDSITIDDDDVPPVLEPEYVGEYWKPYWSSDGQHKDSKGKEVDHVAGEEVDVNDCDVEHPYHYDSKYYNEIQCRQYADPNDEGDIYYDNVSSYEWSDVHKRWISTEWSKKRKLAKNDDPNVHFEAGAGFVVAMKMNNMDEETLNEQKAIQAYETRDEEDKNDDYYLHNKDFVWDEYRWRPKEASKDGSNNLDSVQDDNSVTIVDNYTIHSETAKSKGMTRRRRGRNCKFNIVPEDQMVQLFHSRNVVTIYVRMMVSSKSKFFESKMLEVKQETTIADLKEMIEKLIGADKPIDGLRILKDGKDLDYTGSVKSNGIQNECTLTLSMSGKGGTKKFTCGQPVKILDEDATFLALHRDGKEAVVSFDPAKRVEYVPVETIKSRSRAKSPVEQLIKEQKEINEYREDEYVRKIDYDAKVNEKFGNEYEYTKMDYSKDVWDGFELEDNFLDFNDNKKAYEVNNLIGIYLTFDFEINLGDRLFQPNSNYRFVKPSDRLVDVFKQYATLEVLNNKWDIHDYDSMRRLLKKLKVSVKYKEVDINKSFRENGIEHQDTIQISLKGLLGGTKRKFAETKPEESEKESDLLVELKVCCFKMYCLNTSQIHKLGIGNSSYRPMISAEIMGPYEPRYSYNPKIADEALRQKYAEVMKQETEKAQVDPNGDIEKEMKFLNEHLNCERAVRDHLGKCFITRLFHEGCSINGDHVRNVVRPATKLIEEGKPNDYFFRFSYDEVTEKKAADKKETERQLRAWQQCASKKGVKIYTLQHWGPKVPLGTPVKVFFRHSNGVSMFGTEDISSETVKTTEDGFKEEICGETLYAFDVELSVPWQHVNEIVDIGFPDKDENTEKLAFEEEQNIQDEVEKQIEAENQKKTSDDLIKAYMKKRNLVLENVVAKLTNEQPRAPDKHCDLVEHQKAKKLKELQNALTKEEFIDCRVNIELVEDGDCLITAKNRDYSGLQEYIYLFKAAKVEDWEANWDTSKAMPEVDDDDEEGLYITFHPDILKKKQPLFTFREWSDEEKKRHREGRKRRKKEKERREKRRERAKNRPFKPFTFMKHNPNHFHQIYVAKPKPRGVRVTDKTTGSGFAWALPTGYRKDWVEAERWPKDDRRRDNMRPKDEVKVYGSKSDGTQRYICFATEALICANDSIKDDEKLITNDKYKIPYLALEKDFLDHMELQVLRKCDGVCDIDTPQKIAKTFPEYTTVAGEKHDAVHFCDSCYEDGDLTIVSECGHLERDTDTVTMICQVVEGWEGLWCDKCIDKDTTYTTYDDKFGNHCIRYVPKKNTFGKEYSSDYTGDGPSDAIQFLRHRHHKANTTKIILLIDSCTRLLLKIIVVWGVMLWVYLVFSYVQAYNIKVNLFGKEYSSDYTGDGPKYTKPIDVLAAVARTAIAAVAHAKKNEKTNKTRRGKALISQRVSIYDDGKWFSGIITDFRRFLRGKWEHQIVYDVDKGVVMRSVPQAQQLLANGETTQEWLVLEPEANSKEPKITWKIVKKIAPLSKDELKKIAKRASCHSCKMLRKKSMKCKYCLKVSCEKCFNRKPCCQLHDVTVNSDYLMKRFLDVCDIVKALKRENEQLKEKVTKLTQPVNAFGKEYSSDYTGDGPKRKTATIQNNSKRKKINPVKSARLKDLYEKALNDELVAFPKDMDFNQTLAANTNNMQQTWGIQAGYTYTWKKGQICNIILGFKEYQAKTLVFLATFRLKHIDQERHYQINMLLMDGWKRSAIDMVKRSYFNYYNDNLANGYTMNTNEFNCLLNNRFFSQAISILKIQYGQSTPLEIEYGKLKKEHERLKTKYNTLNTSWNELYKNRTEEQKQLKLKCGELENVLEKAKKIFEQS